MNTPSIYFSNNINFPHKIITFSLFLIAFLGYLNETLLNVALSTLMQTFSISKEKVQWLSTGFLLIMGAFAPLSAQVLQWFKTRVLAIFTLFIFLIGLLICASAPNFFILLFGRIIQALAAAFSVPLLIQSILAIYPPEKRGRAMSLVTVIFTVAPAIGPTLSGVILEYLNWRYLFLINIPFVLLAMILIIKNLKVDLINITRPTINFISVIYSIFGFGGFIFSITQFNELVLWQFIIVLLCSLLFVYLFISRQFKLISPLLNLNILTIRQFRYSMSLIFIGYFIFIGLELLLPIYLQQVLLLSALLTGFILLPASLAEAISAPIFGWIVDKNRARFVLIFGMSIMIMAVFSLAMMIHFSLHIATISASFAALAVAVAAAVAGETHGLNHLTPENNPHGSAIISTILPISGALGVAFFIGITRFFEQKSQFSAELAMKEGVVIAILSSLIMACLAFFIALNIRREY